MAMFVGSQQFDGRVWSPGIKISGINSPAESWTVDPQLPAIGTDPRYPTSDQIVIPRGRILAVRPDTSAYTGLAVLTISDGVNNKPAGYNSTNILRQWSTREQWYGELNKQEFMEVPYVQTINGAYGTLQGGSKITGYYGSVLSTAGVPNDKGKPVAWVEKTMYAAHQTAAATAALAQANFPAFPPTIVMAWNAGTVYAGAAPTVAWNPTLSEWVATFATAVTDVIFTFGQGVSQIAGEVIRIEPISPSHNLSGWLQWVQDDFLAWEYPPQLLRVPTTAVTSEIPQTISTNWYRLGNAPMAPWLTATVTITGTITNLDGSQTVVNGTPLALAGLPFVDYTLGEYYNINPVTGDIFINGNVSVTAITVSYSYETSYRDGRLYNAGVIGLTDGRYSGVPGTPANLEVVGVVGSLRCIIY